VNRDPDVPPGWHYDPSAWSHRLPCLVLAVLGLLIAGYLALYQLGVFATVWEPFFGRGSVVILHSAVAKLLPFPDALLGVAGYLGDLIFGLIGGRGRWRTAPWAVLVFGLFVAGMGLGSLFLVLLQPTAFHAWCTLCLASAAVSLLIAWSAADEVLATLEHLKRQKAAGRSLWQSLGGPSGATSAVG
jgi:uncharacterized membrane protein